jgi:hypothetical protein
MSRNQPRHQTPRARKPRHRQPSTPVPTALLEGRDYMRHAASGLLAASVVAATGLELLASAAGSAAAPMSLSLVAENTIQPNTPAADQSTHWLAVTPRPAATPNSGTDLLRATSISGRAACYGPMCQGGPGGYVQINTDPSGQNLGYLTLGAGWGRGGGLTLQSGPAPTTWGAGVNGILSLPNNSVVASHDLVNGTTTVLGTSDGKDGKFGGVAATWDGTGLAPTITGRAGVAKSFGIPEQSANAFITIPIPAPAPFPKDLHPRAPDLTADPSSTPTFTNTDPKVLQQSLEDYLHNLDNSGQTAPPTDTRPPSAPADTSPPIDTPLPTDTTPPAPVDSTPSADATSPTDSTALGVPLDVTPPADVTPSTDPDAPTVSLDSMPPGDTTSPSAPVDTPAADSFQAATAPVDSASVGYPDPGADSNVGGFSASGSIGYPDPGTGLSSGGLSAGGSS